MMKRPSPALLAAAGAATVAAIPTEQVTSAAAAVGALASLGVLVGVYRMPLNRCRCTPAERRASRTSLLHMHCRRCMKRTNKGIAVSFLYSPLYCAGAAVGVAQAAHVAGTPMLNGVVKPVWRKAKALAKWV